MQDLIRLTMLLRLLFYYRLYQGSSSLIQWDFWVHFLLLCRFSHWRSSRRKQGAVSRVSSDTLSSFLLGFLLHRRYCYSWDSARDFRDSLSYGDFLLMQLRLDSRFYSHEYLESTKSSEPCFWWLLLGRFPFFQWVCSRWVWFQMNSALWASRCSWESAACLHRWFDCRASARSASEFDSFARTQCADALILQMLFNSILRKC